MVARLRRDAWKPQRAASAAPHRRVVRVADAARSAAPLPVPARRARRRSPPARSAPRATPRRARRRRRPARPAGSACGRAARSGAARRAPDRRAARARAPSSRSARPRPRRAASAPQRVVVAARAHPDVAVGIDAELAQRVARQHPARERVVAVEGHARAAQLLGRRPSRVARRDEQIGAVERRRPRLPAPAPRAARSARRRRACACTADRTRRAGRAARRRRPGARPAASRATARSVTPVCARERLRDGLVVRARDLTEEAVDGERSAPAQGSRGVVHQLVDQIFTGPIPDAQRRMPTVASTERGRAAGRSRVCQPWREGTCPYAEFGWQGHAVALGAVAVLGADDVRERTGDHRCWSGQHQDRGHHAARQALAAVARGDRRAGLDRAREPVGPDELVRVLQRRPDAAGAGRRAGHRARTSRRRRASPTRTPTSCVKGQHGADPKYDYGTHFLYQGHELDTADGRLHHAHQPRRRRRPPRDEARRDRGRRQTPIPEIDGSTWDPFAQRLLFTTEGGAEGGVDRGARSTIPSKVSTLWGVLGQGGYEGIQNDQLRQRLHRRGHRRPGRQGQHARQAAEQLRLPLPAERPDQPRQGRQAAGAAGRVARASRRRSSSTTARPTPTSSRPTPRTCTPTAMSSRRCGSRSTTPTKDGTAAFDANAAAKKAGGTPFKRPENGQFKPGTGFKKFFFAETGDTTLTTEAGTQYGGFGAIQELRQDPKSDKGTLRLFYQSDKAHSSFDNVTFFDKTHVIVRAGPGRRPAQRRSTRSTRASCSTSTGTTPSGAQPVRVIAEGRDPSATIDSATRRHLGQRLQQRGRQRDHRHPRVQRRPDGRRPARRRDPEGPLARLAALLHPPARRQRDLRGHSRLIDPLQRRGRPRPTAAGRSVSCPDSVRRVDADVHVVVVADQRLDDARRAVQREVRADEDELGPAPPGRGSSSSCESGTSTCSTLVGATSRPSRRG